MYADRSEAGRALARHLIEFADNPMVIVLALPRGGVPVAYEIALALRADLDVFPVRKLGVPGHEELAMGAIGLGGTIFLNDQIIRRLRIKPEEVEREIEHEWIELDRRRQVYRGSTPFPTLTGKTVILIDDGLATGATMLAAVRGVKMHHPEKVVVAVPVAASESCREVEAEAQVFCPIRTDTFTTVGEWYDDFSATTDWEVRTLMEQSSQWERFGSA